jgi:hypothetical protein
MPVPRLACTHPWIGACLCPESGPPIRTATGWQWARYARGQIRSAASTSVSSLRHWISSVTALPM